MGGLSSRWSGTPQSLDRALVIACAAIWLLVVGMGVAAAVALADLGRGHSAGESGSGTSWLLYVVIAVSASVIALAIPLLLRARRAAVVATDGGGAAAAPSRPAPVLLVDHESPGYVVPSRVPVEGPVPDDLLDRIWMRCGVGILAVMGAAMLAVALAAYLLAVASETGAWVALGVAAVLTIAMSVIPALSLRVLRAELELH